MTMTYEYLYELADLADPDQLWRLSPLDQMELPVEEKRKLHTGVALRRYAQDVRQLGDLIGTGRSLVLTPLSKGSRAIMTIKAPKAHQKFIDQRS